MKNIKIWIIIVLLLLIIGFLAVNYFSHSRDGQISFVTQFYKAYLDSIKSDKSINWQTFLSSHSVFTESAKLLLNSNYAICASKAGTDVCGYGADGDIFLNTQETGPNLNFETSSFAAKSVSSEIVEVSFSVWPGQGEYYNKKLRLSLMKEHGQWRVNDIILPDDKGEFKNENSMRLQIQKETEYYSK